MAKHDYTEPSLTVKTAIDTYVEADMTELYAEDATLAQAIIDGDAANDVDIQANAVNIASNDVDIAANAANIALNDIDIAANAANITSNDVDIATNAANITSNDVDIAASAADIVDLETLTQETIGVNSNITEITGLTTALTISQGGTGQDTRQEAIDALTSAVTATEEDVLTIQTGVAVFLPPADASERTKTTRQTMLTGPDLQATLSTVETSATKTGVDLRSQYLDVDSDMLTGSRGALVITKRKDSGYGTLFASSILGEIQDFLNSSNTDAVNTAATNKVQQLLASGVQLGSGADYVSANLYTFMTNRDEIIDGNRWQWNDESGFFMCTYVGTGVAFDLTHPMGTVPMFFATKNIDVVKQWLTGRANTTNYMALNDSLAEASSPSVLPAISTDGYIPLGTDTTVNAVSETYFMFGWAGDPLDDLHVGMRGVRGVTASYNIVSTGSDVVDTGITDIQAVMYKRKDLAGSWIITNKASGFNNYTLLDATSAEAAGSGVSVAGSIVTLATVSDRDYLVVVIGSTATAPDNKLKTATEVLRKVGTAATGHRVDLGAAYSGGDAGGMLFGRPVGSVAANWLFDTIRGTDYLQTNANAGTLAGSSLLQGYTTTGVTLAAHAGFNPAELCQYTAFNTTHKATIDGDEWHYNPLTGFGMVKYSGQRVISHPMGKKPRMMWVKNLNSTADWYCYFDTLGATKYTNLNSTGQAFTNSAIWDDIEPTDFTITFGSSSGVSGGAGYILYGWFGDDLSAELPGVTGERGVSAFMQTNGIASPQSIDTGIDSITAVLWKASSSTSDWWWSDIKTGNKYPLNLTSVEVPETAITVDGSVVTFSGSATVYELIAFGSKADSGVDNDVILPSTPSDPNIVSMANGFNSMGNVDTIKKLIASQTLNITGQEGQKFIYMKQDGLLYFTDVRPLYLRDYVPYVRTEKVYDIDKAVMYDVSGVVEPGVFVGECWVDNLGNVYDIVTYAKGDVDLSDSFTAIASTIFALDNPFGHLEVLTQLIGETATSKELVSTELIEVDEDSITITLDASPDAPVYKTNTRRNF